MSRPAYCRAAGELLIGIRRAAGPLHQDYGVERDQSDREIRWVRGDAALAAAEDRVQAVIALERAVAGARARLLQGTAGSRK